MQISSLANTAVEMLLLWRLSNYHSHKENPNQPGLAFNKIDIQPVPKIENHISNRVNGPYNLKHLLLLSVKYREVTGSPLNNKHSFS